MRACELLWRNLAVCHAAIDAAAPALRDVGLEPKQLHLLGLLDENPHPAGLARAMVVPAPTVTFLIKRAEAAGHLRRDAVVGDLRKYRLSLTPAGRRVLDRGREAIDRAFGLRLAALSGAERATLERLVVKLQAAPPHAAGVRPTNA